MMKHRIILWFFVTVATTVSAQTVTLDSCRRWSKANYPLIQQYQIVSQSEAYSVSNAARAWLPQVRFSAQATWQTDAARYPEEMNDMLAVMGVEIDGIRQDQYKIALDISQNIWDGGRSRADKDIAQAQAEADRLAVDVDFYTLESRVDNLYFGILLLEGQKTQNRHRLELLEENRRRCQVLAENDMLLQSDLDAVEVEIITVNQRNDQINSSCEAYRQMLSLMTGRNLSTAELTTPPSVETRHGTSLQQNNRPELQLLDARIDLLTAQQKMVKVASMPQFSLFAQGWYGYPGLNMFENMQNAKWSLNAIVGARMQWNIGAYYTQGNRLNQLRNMQQQLKVQREVFNFNNQLEQSQENGEISRLQRTLQDDERIVQLRRSVREAGERKHDNGIISTSELLQLIGDESVAQSALILHQIELLKKQYEYKHTINL